MSVLDIADQGPGQNPRAPGVLSFGREGATPGFTVTTEGDAVFQGTVTSAGGGGGGVSVTRGIITTGNVTLANTAGAWAAVPGISAACGPCAVGDNVEFQPGFMWDPTGTTQFLDLAVLVGGSLVRFSSNRTATPAVEGDPTIYPAPETYRTPGCVFDFEVEAGDLDGGNLTIVLATRGNGVGTVFASASFPWRWTFRNFGQ